MLRYFLGVEVMRSKHGIFLSQRKYVLDLLSETGKLGAKPCNSPMAPGHCYQNRTIHDSIHKSIHDSVGERSDSFKESKICLNRRQNHRITNRFT